MDMHQQHMNMVNQMNFDNFVRESSNFSMSLNQRGKSSTTNVKTPSVKLRKSEAAILDSIIELGKTDVNAARELADKHWMDPKNSEQFSDLLFELIGKLNKLWLNR